MPGNAIKLLAQRVEGHMSVAELVSRVQSAQEFDLKEIRDAIYAEADKPCTEKEYVVLIKLYHLIWDRAERATVDSPPEQKQKMKNLRESDYGLLLIKECTVGDNICADTLLAVTTREIEAGRMAPDNGLHADAVKRVSEPHPSRAEMIAIAQRDAQPKKRGFLSRLFG